jgi:hypothetical protein
MTGFDLSDLTPIEIDVLNDPDKLYYKYVVTDIRPEVAELIGTGLPVEETKPYLESIAPSRVIN